MKLKSEYSNGLLKATEQMIYYCEAQINKIKSGTKEANTPRQITNGGKLLAYNKVLTKLMVKKDNILKYDPSGK